jgi:hypothetical protein
MPRRILSIASAPGWKARIAAGGEPESESVVTLVAWALVESPDSETEIVGVVQRGASDETPHGLLALADEVDGFSGYTFTGLAMRRPDD